MNTQRVCAFCGFPEKPRLWKRHPLGWRVCGLCLHGYLTGQPRFIGVSTPLPAWMQ